MCSSLIAHRPCSWATLKPEASPNTTPPVIHSWLQALTEATGRSLAQLKKELETTGDMGSVAAASRGSQRTMLAPKRLTVQSVRAANDLCRREP